MLLRGRLPGALALLLALAGCGTMPNWMSASGPSREQVQNSADAQRVPGIRVLSVDDALARTLADGKQLDRFNQVFAGAAGNQYQVGPGDVIEVSVWEAPPAVLFGGMVVDPAVGPTTTRVVTFPEQMVMADGTITMPFAGHIPVRKRTTRQIEDDITKRLQGQANHPQVLVRVVQNNTSNVTVVGDVQKSTLMPLTPKGEKLLDALAAGGGAAKPIDRMAIQLSRGPTTATMALDDVIRDPHQNISLRPGDVVTALFQPQNFTVLGATGKNEEIPFEARGITLAQALARSGGLSDNRADARGVFVFRFENAALLSKATGTAVDPTQQSGSQQGTVPVVYEIDLRDPASFFVAQHFPVQNQDLIYVANSPAAELDKFLRMVGSVFAPVFSVERIAN